MKTSARNWLTIAEKSRTIQIRFTLDPLNLKAEIFIPASL